MALAIEDKKQIVAEVNEAAAIVQNAADMAIERALAHKDGQMNLRWGNFVKSSVTASV